MARNIVAVTINKNVGDSATVSTLAKGNGATPVGIYFPSSFSGNSVTFLALAGNNADSPNSLHATGLMTDGTSTITKTVAAGSYLSLSRDLFSGVDALQIISNSSETNKPTLLVVFN